MLDATLLGNLGSIYFGGLRKSNIVIINMQDSVELSLGLGLGIVIINAQGWVRVRVIYTHILLLPYFLWGPLK